MSFISILLYLELYSKANYCFINNVVKFGLSEKHRKFETNFPHGLDVY